MRVLYRVYPHFQVFQTRIQSRAKIVCGREASDKVKEEEDEEIRLQIYASNTRNERVCQNYSRSAEVRE